VSFARSRVESTMIGLFSRIGTPWKVDMTSSTATGGRSRLTTVTATLAVALRPEGPVIV